jgi:hypothetical protein
MLKTFAGAASPTALATFNTSVELLSAKIGTSLVPMLDQLSLTVQSAADALDKIPREARVAFGKEILPSAVKTALAPLLAVQPQLFFQLGGAIDKFFTGRPTPSFAGLPQGQVQTIEQAVATAQAAALNIDPLKAKVEQEQLANLRESKLLLQDIARNTAPMRGYEPTFG